MLTPHMAQAYDELSKLDQSIQEAKANIRVLDAMGSPNVLTLRNNLAVAEEKRRVAMAAIEAERNNLD